MSKKNLSYEEWSALQTALERCSEERRRAALAIIECLPHLGENATAMLVDQAQGLRDGAPIYGDWNENRDMAREAMMEARDGVSYSRRKIVQLKQELAEWEGLNGTFVRAHGQARALSGVK